jgi:undecaprenyl pyrophosphate synthase
MRRTRRDFASASVALALAAAAGCASGTKVADKEVGDVELSIRSAENATATQHAKILLDRARNALSAAQSERAKGHDGAARARLEEARSAASAAESQASSVQALEQEAALKRQIDEIERRIREFNAQAQRR